MSSFNIDSQLVEIPDWLKYAPHEPQYAKFPMNVVVAAKKIEDVYHAFGYARSSLAFMDCDDYGQVVPKDDQVSMTFFRSMLAVNALSFYNYAIDLSWQVIWLFYENDNLDLVYDDRVYRETVGRCNLETLRLRLWLARDFKAHDHLVSFFESKLVKEVRRKYNYIKHRGMFHFPGLGENYDSLMFSLNGVSPKVIKREEFDLADWVATLIQFDNEFINYFNHIISFVIPSGYLNKSLDIGDMLSYGRKVQQYLKSKA